MNHGVGLDDDQDGAPIRPETGQPDPEDPVALPEPRPFRALLQDRELLAKSKVLGSQRGLIAKKGSKKNEDHQNPAHTRLPIAVPHVCT